LLGFGRAAEPTMRAAPIHGTSVCGRPPRQWPFIGVMF
jgi:hypothetical protein